MLALARASRRRPSYPASPSRALERSGSMPRSGATVEPRMAVVQGRRELRYLLNKYLPKAKSQAAAALTHDIGACILSYIYARS